MTNIKSLIFLGAFLSNEMMNDCLLPEHNSGARIDCRSLKLVLHKRNIDIKSGTFVYFALRSDEPVMIFDNFLNNRQSDACT